MLFEFGSDEMSKSLVAQQVEENPMEQKLKNYVDLEWSLVFVEEDGVLLIFARAKAKVN